MANNSVVTQEVLQNALENYHENFVYPYLNGATHTGFTPVGTVISYFGETAPEHFLICDGTEYAKSDYPQLADLLLNLTDPTPYEGSDSDHFKVPDLRGEFLRGSGTNGHVNNGNGANVGVHQDATISMGLSQDANGDLTINRNPSHESEVGQKNVDTYLARTHYKTYSTSVGGASTWDNPTAAVEYTSRPTNTSVLYCIAYKNIYIDLALDSFPLSISNPTDGQALVWNGTEGRWKNAGILHEYSTDEHIVGIWTDGKLVYERTFILNNINSDSTSILNDSNVKVIEDKWVGKTAEGATYTSNSYTGEGDVQVCCFVATNSAGNILFFRRGTLYITSAKITLKYTKTTD